ncbi:MAG: hypothetical protein QW128_07840 [Thermoprotei archaeon]
MKTVGIIGMLLFLGIIIQIVLGHVAANDVFRSTIIPVHIVIGVLGLILIGYETFYALKHSKNYIKILTMLALVLVIIQVGIGASMMESDIENLTIAHQINAYALLILLAGIGYLTFKGSKVE